VLLLLLDEVTDWAVEELDDEDELLDVTDWAVELELELCEDFELELELLLELELWLLALDLLELEELVNDCAEELELNSAKAILK
jgi:hypothetical protein